VRLKIAVLIAKFAALLSKRILRRSGETISGRVLLALYPRAIAELSKSKKIICVSGTNGKTSTTKALVSIISSISKLGTVATSPSGSNLERGVAAALMQKSDFAVLEVDELHISRVIEEAKPKVVLLLNLTRDQLHRMHEVKRVADRWAKSASAAPGTLFVGDVDDPFVAVALNSAAQSKSISFGGRKHQDGAVCPSCGKYLKWVRNNYKCPCGLTNSNPDEIFEAGSAAFRNATMANVVGKSLGAKPIAVDEKSLERSVDQIHKGVKANIRLTKNPASWTEALKSVTGDNAVLIVNAHEVDGIDTSWLWDISFSGLSGKRVVVCGERALDIAYRLHVEGIEAEITSSFKDAISKFESGASVQVLAAYTAFHELVNS
jgi:lipid II isoglutaminyl synthase (glutamine-hydrolysing)